MPLTAAGVYVVTAFPYAVYLSIELSDWRRFRRCRTAAVDCLQQGQAKLTVMAICLKFIHRYADHTVCFASVRENNLIVTLRNTTGRRIHALAYRRFAQDGKHRPRRGSALPERPPSFPHRRPGPSGERRSNDGNWRGSRVRMNIHTARELIKSTERPVCSALALVTPAAISTENSIACSIAL